MSKTTEKDIRRVGRGWGFDENFRLLEYGASWFGVELTNLVLPRRWRHHISPKSYLYTTTHGIMTQKTEMLVKLSGDVHVLHFEVRVVFAGMSRPLGVRDVTTVFPQ